MPLSSPSSVETPAIDPTFAVVPWLTAAAGLGAWRMVAGGWPANRALAWTLLYALAVLLIGRALDQPGIVRRLAGTATADSLGKIRALVGLVLLVSVLWEDVASTALIPADLRHPSGIYQLLNVLLPVPLDRLLSSAAALSALKYATALALALATVGLGTRAALVVGGVGYLLIAGTLRLYSWFYHVGLVPWYLLVVLVFTPCGDGFSLDARRRPRSPRSAQVYGLARLACWVALALPYAAAGLSKLRNGGLRWFAADNMRAIVFTDSLNPMQFSFDLGLALRQAPDLVWSGLALAAVALEIGYLAVLVWPRARRILAISTAGMHLGILLLQNVFFPDLLALQAVLLLDRGAATGGAAPASASPSPVYPAAGRLGVICLAALLLLPWAFQIEAFPLTGMQMYSYPQAGGASGRIEYHKVRGFREDGSSFDTPIEEAIGALADSRYRHLVRSRSIGRGLQCDFMEAVARAHAKKSPEGRWLSRIEVERWVWSFRRDPLDPDFGTLSERRSFQFDSGDPRSRRPDEVKVHCAL